MTTAAKLFNRHSLRCTAQRVALYETLLACGSHPTADELFNMVKPRMGKLSLATVYNTLEALCVAGLARKLATTNGCCRYDGDTSIHPHIRFRDTDEIEDVPDELSQRLVQGIPQDVLDEIGERLSVDISGLNIQLIANRRPSPPKP